MLRTDGCSQYITAEYLFCGCKILGDSTGHEDRRTKPCKLTLRALTLSANQRTKDLFPAISPPYEPGSPHYNPFRMFRAPLLQHHTIVANISNDIMILDAPSPQSQDLMIVV